MKWIEVRTGSYKYVDDSDTRPEVTLKNKKGSPLLATTPPWSTTEKYISIGDANTQRRAGEVFDDERRGWTGTSTKLRKWEADRKKSWAKDKPAWRKEQMKKDPIGWS